MKKKKVPKTLWGLTPTPEFQAACSPELLEIKYFDLVESQHSPPLGTSMSISSTIWTLTPDEAIARQERQALLQCLCIDRHSIACVMNLTSPFLNHPDAKDRTLSFIRSWDITSSCPLYFDTGKMGPPPWLPLEHCVSDPLWFEGEIWGSYWKIHGWHESRWVRTYPEAALKQLLRTSRRHSPLCIVLAHSQRALQLNVIQSLSPEYKI